MNKKGFTLVGAVLMGILIAITTVAGMDFYNSIQHQRRFINDRFEAINLANAQIEDLMAMEYADPPLNPVAVPPHATTFATLPAGFGVTYTVLAEPPFNITGAYSITYKLITVSAIDPRGNIVRIQGFKTS